NTRTGIQGTGNGGVTVGTLQVGGVVLNPTFFPNNQVITSYSLRVSTGLEYQNVDPAQQLDAQPNGGGFIASIPTGIANGTPVGNQSDKELIETDTKDSFRAATIVNEPETVT